MRWQSHWKFVSDEGAHKSMLMLSDVQVAVRLQLLFKFRSCFRFSYEIVLLFSDYAFGIVGHGPAPFSLCLVLTLPQASLHACERVRSRPGRSPLSAMLPLTCS